MLHQNRERRLGSSPAGKLLVPPSITFATMLISARATEWCVELDRSTDAMGNVPAAFA
jgi:hypothetical protein